MTPLLFSSTKNNFRYGFTLIELLVTLTFLSILVGLSVPIANSMFRSGKKANEIAAARNLITAYLLYPSDHDGELMPGWKADEPAFDENGNALSYPVNARYPWRLAPYLDYRFKGSLLVNEQEKLLKQQDNAYALSVQPSFGLNSVFVGGHYGGSSDLKPSNRAFDMVGPFCVQRLVQAKRPSLLIVFASSRSTINDKTVEGYELIKSPFFTSKRWNSKFEESESADQFGFVHPRHDGKAIVACLDGSVKALNEKELQDMRRWSNQAAKANNPEWTISRQ